jgi:hypothetical protein
VRCIAAGIGEVSHSRLFPLVNKEWAQRRWDRLVANLRCRFASRL